MGSTHGSLRIGQKMSSRHRVDLNEVILLRFVGWDPAQYNHLVASGSQTAMLQRRCGELY
jgi:hypothetical protein